MEDELQMIKIELEGSESQENELYEEFYENIEAPKFVDFTTPNHYCPDDRFWFCQRQGCDQKHEEEMDSEAIYKNFVLRVMAARSPNVRLQKALNRNALSKTMKCPASAPLKSSIPRVSKLAFISSLSGKLAVDKEDVTKPPPMITSSSTPKPKRKQVAAKYLTTPRNRTCLQDETSFRSVQHPKPGATASKEKTVVKALVFHSAELKTPLSKLRSQKKPAGPPRKRVTFEEESREKIRSGAQTEKTKVLSSRTLKSSTKRGSDRTDKKPRVTNVEEISSCTTLNSDFMSLEVLTELENPSNSKPFLVEEIDLLKMQVPNIEDTPQDVGIESEFTDGDDKENDLPRGVEIESEVTNSDNKENTSVTDANRCLNKTSSEARSKIMPNGRGKLIRAVQLVDKSTKEGITPMKIKKPKSTHPKPFRFRTDERRILKEAANTEKKVHLLATQTEPAKPSMEGKPKRKLVKYNQGDEKRQDKCNSEVVKYSAKMPERKILAEVTSGERIQVAQKGLKSSGAIPKRLMQVRKMTSPLKQEIDQPEREAKSSTLAHANKLNMVKETSSSITRPRKTMTRKENTATTASTGATCNQPTQKRLTVTIPKEPNLHTAHRPKSCTKQVV